MTIAPDVTVQDAEAFRTLEQTLSASGPRAALDQLVDHLAERGSFVLCSMRSYYGPAMSWDSP